MGWGGEEREDEEVKAVNLQKVKHLSKTSDKTTC